MTTKPEISVVVPVFRSKATLDALYDRVCNVLDDVASSWEIILVDDASNDGTFDIMLQLHRKDPRVKLIRFARNMGQHQATLCGLQKATRQFVFTLDDDLQNPPEEIPHFIDKLKEGYDLVIGKITTSKKHSASRNLSSRIVQHLVSHILGKPKDIAMSSYRCMTQRVAHSMGSFKGGERLSCRVDLLHSSQRPNSQRGRFA